MRYLANAALLPISPAREEGQHYFASQSSTASLVRVVLPSHALRVAVRT